MLADVLHNIHHLKFPTFISLLFFYLPLDSESLLFVVLPALLDTALSFAPLSYIHLHFTILALAMVVMMATMTTVPDERELLSCSELLHCKQ